MQSPAERAAVTESMNHDLNRVSVRCDLLEMKLTAGNTKTMIWTSLQITNSSSPINPIDSGWNSAEESADRFILWVMFDAKVTFEKHLRSVSSAAAQRLGITRKSWQIFHDWSFLLRFFFLCPDSLVVLLSTVVFGCRLTSDTVGQSSQFFFSRWCFGVPPYPSSICGGVLHAI